MGVCIDTREKPGFSCDRWRLFTVLIVKFSFSESLNAGKQLGPHFVRSYEKPGFFPAGLMTKRTPVIGHLILLAVPVITFHGDYTVIRDDMADPKIRVRAREMRVRALSSMGNEKKKKNKTKQEMKERHEGSKASIRLNTSAVPRFITRSKSTNEGPGKCREWTSQASQAPSQVCVPLPSSSLSNTSDPNGKSTQSTRHSIPGILISERR